MTGLWTFAGRSLTLDRPRVMAILNVTPDSFFDGGVLAGPEAAVAAAHRAVGEGADLLDIGGESTRPGARRVPEEEQIGRVVPVIEAIRAAGVDLPISVDTTRASVARAAAEAGAQIVNDVSGGEEDPEMLGLVAQLGLGLVLMHRLRPPESDNYSDRYGEAPRYGDVVEEVRTYLAGRVAAAEGAGLPASAVLVDPGLGFGKSVEQNLDLVRGTGRLRGLGAGVLSAASRKSFVGRVSLGRDSEPSERLAGSIAFSLMHLKAGARVFRVHDVGEQGRALRAGWMLMDRSAPGMGG
ncbi:MAG: dihydropteroate synthase [Phycisphaerales bacterium]|nr:dihydropteroate synthase [Phycisphaerales bacterium]